MNTQRNMDEYTKQKINFIVSNIKKGNKESLNELHSLIGATIRHIALKYLRDDDSANEMIQDFWADIHTTISKIYFFQNSFSFLCKTMINMTLNRCKKLGLEKKTFVSFADYSVIESSKDIDYDHLMLRNDIHKAMDELSIEEKTIIQLTYFEDKTIRAISKEIKMSKSHVGRIKTKAIKKMKDCLESLSWDKNDE